MRAIVYVRYSTHKQDSGLSIEQQIARCKEYAAFRNYEIAEIIEDAAISGGTTKREGFGLLLKRLEEDNIDICLVYDLSRLSRDMLALLALERLFDELEVELHTVEGAIGTDSPENWMSFAMRAFLGEMERRTVKHRTKKAIGHLKEKGQVYSRTPYGYRREGKELIEIETEQKVIELIKRLYKNGKTLADIQRALKKKKILTRGGKDWVPSQVKRLIPDYEETHQRGGGKMLTALKAFLDALD